MRWGPNTAKRWREVKFSFLQDGATRHTARDNNKIPTSVISRELQPPYFIIQGLSWTSS